MEQFIVYLIGLRGFDTAFLNLNLRRPCGRFQPQISGQTTDLGLQLCKGKFSHIFRVKFALIRELRFLLNVWKWKYKMRKSVHESKFNSMSVSGDYVVKNKLLIAVENEDLPLLAVKHFSWLRTGLSNRIRKFCKYFNF